MFARIFAADPCKIMDRQLRDSSPDPSLWSEIAAYLCRGRRPKSQAARAAIRAYLDLREGLTGQAAFKMGDDLSHQSLAGPSRDFFASYQPRQGLDLTQAMAWARFLLAADHLQARAYEASLSTESRSAQCCRMDELFGEAREAYIVPLAQEITDQDQPAAQAEPAQAEPQLFAALAA